MDWRLIPQEQYLNYANGLNNPLGKIVVANFNNQNGLKQIGSATYVETAVSGSPQVGEAGAEALVIFYLVRLSVRMWILLRSWLI